MLDLYWSSAFDRSLLADHKSSASLKVRNSYLVPEISGLSFLAAGKTYNVNSFISFDRYGYHQYNESGITAGVARSLTNSLAISTGIGIKRTRIPEMVYSDVHLTGELSARFILTKQVQLSSSLLQISAKGKHTVQPGAITMMMHYKPSAGVGLTTGLLKSDGNKSLQVFAECHYYINRFMLAGAVTSSPLRYSIGYSWKHKSFKAFMGMTYFTRLGISPSSSVTWVRE